MFNFLKNLFKKNNSDEEVFHYYYGVILTKTHMKTSDKDIISLFSIREKLYPRCNYMFTSYNAAAKYIKENLIRTGNQSPVYAYYIAFRPYTSAENKILHSILKQENSKVDLSLINDSDITICQDVLSKVINCGIHSTIITDTDLHICMRAGLDEFIRLIIWEKLMKSCSKYRIPSSVVEDAGNKLGKEEVVEMYNWYFHRSDGWERDFINDLKSKI